MKKVKLVIKQVLIQRVAKQTHTIVESIVEKEIAGPSPYEVNWVRFMHIDLNAIRYDILARKKKHGKFKTVSAEDKFQMASMQPECHAANFTNEYFLCVEIAHDSYFTMAPSEEE